MKNRTNPEKKTIRDLVEELSLKELTERPDNQVSKVKPDRKEEERVDCKIVDCLDSCSSGEGTSFTFVDDKLYTLDPNELIPQQFQKCVADLELNKRKLAELQTIHWHTVGSLKNLHRLPNLIALVEIQQKEINLLKKLCEDFLNPNFQKYIKIVRDEREDVEQANVFYAHLRKSFESVLSNTLFEQSRPIVDSEFLDKLNEVFPGGVVRTGQLELREQAPLRVHNLRCFLEMDLKFEKLDIILPFITQALMKDEKAYNELLDELENLTIKAQICYLKLKQKDSELKIEVEKLELRKLEKKKSQSEIVKSESEKKSEPEKKKSESEIKQSDSENEGLDLEMTKGHASLRALLPANKRLKNEVMKKLSVHFCKDSSFEYLDCSEDESDFFIAIGGSYLFEFLTTKINDFKRERREKLVELDETLIKLLSPSPEEKQRKELEHRSERLIDKLSTSLAEGLQDWLTPGHSTRCNQSKRLLGFY